MTVCIKDFIVHLQSQDLFGIFTAISRKVVGKSGFEFAVLQRNLKEWHERLWTYAMALDVCLRVLKESNKRSLDSYSVLNSVLIISHVTFWDRPVHIFADNLSRNSCIYNFTCIVNFA